MLSGWTIKLVIGTTIAIWVYRSVSWLATSFNPLGLL